jgi:hypothetical protein
MSTLRETIAIVAALAVPITAAAQDYTLYTVGAVDGEDANIQLAGLSLRPEGLGWKPVGSVELYRLGYPTLTEDVTVWSVTPAVGLGYRAPAGLVDVKVGYGFQEEDGGDRVFFEGGQGGLNTSVQASYWGGQPELQGLARYAWEENNLFSQGQATFPITDLNPGAVSVGGEAAWQGDLSNSEAYRSTQLGPVLRWSSGTGLISALSGGWKDSNLSDDTWYLRLLFVYSP